MTISESMMVAVSYDLYVPTENNEEELMEQALAQKPFVFCAGLGMTLPKFEEELAGKKVGDKFDFTISKEDGYGEYMDDYVIDLEKNLFEVDGKFDSDMIFPGNIVPLMDSDGNRINASVLEVTADVVKVDLNHPLAGEDLHFVGEVLDVRPASEEEIKALMGGGCGGGCSCDDMDDCSSKSCGCGCGN